MSVMQLNLLGIITKEECEEVLKIVAEHLSFKMNYSYKKKTAFRRIFMYGQEVFRQELILTDEDFDLNFNRYLSEYIITYTSEKGFTFIKIDSS